MMNGREKSDRPIVPAKSTNNGRDYWSFLAERMEGRGLAKEKQHEEGSGVARQSQPRAQADPKPQPYETLRSSPRLPVSPRQALPAGAWGMSEAGCPEVLDRIRQAACRDRKLRFTNLWHHVYAVERLRKAYFELSKQAAPGIDGQTWSDYGKDLESNLQNLSARLARGNYKAPPVRRVHIPKGNGKQRPIGIPAIEDKVVQRATVAVLNAVYETDFIGFSYGFRPGKSAHKALDALAVAIQTRKVNYVLDADIRSFFDTLDHGWLMKFVEHRIADRRVLRHIRKWLNAGVMEEGRRVEQVEGVPQGGSISPLLANIYLHYVLDLWACQWRKRPQAGDVIVVRYADDFVVGFEHETDAQAFLGDLRERFRGFNLALHDQKTRVLPFGRHAARKRGGRDDDRDDDRRGRGDENPSDPQNAHGRAADCRSDDGDASVRKDQTGGQAAPSRTFHFLGFTHSCGKTRKGRFVVLRLTMAARMRAKLKSLRDRLKRRMHEGINATGQWLGSVLRGHIQYYGVPRNSQPMWSFRAHLTRLWKQALSRRSQKGQVTWARMSRIVKQWLPHPRIVHPYPRCPHA